MSKIWNDWGIEDGDYIAEYDEPIKQFPINTNMVLNALFTIFSIVLFAVVLNLIVKV
ncbi:MAG: hypothetical protein L3J41_12995 [Melioribacteraceae bacterium]|nr:hypothetical protein [Melioribacteraceae bacterium]